MLAIGGKLLSGLPDTAETGLRIWLIGPDPKLQAKIRELASYSYGTSSGVDQKGAPNPWGLRLSGYEFAVSIGIGVAAISAALAAINGNPNPRRYRRISRGIVDLCLWRARGSQMDAMEIHS